MKELVDRKMILNREYSKDDFKQEYLLSLGGGILTHIERVLNMIRDRLKFGLDDLSAAYAREREVKCALISAKKEIEKLQKQIESLKDELSKERSVVDLYAEADRIEKDFEVVDEFTYANGSLARQRQRDRK